MSRLKKALEKAREARGDLWDEKTRPADDSLAVQPGVSSPAVEFKPFKPKYSQTQVVQCDQELLRKNKVIAVCTQDSADRMKILRTQILNQMCVEGRNTLLVTSCNPGEGKTLTAINLAISYSHQLNTTVLLVDADIKKPSIHTYFGLDNGPGLADCLIQKAAVSDVLVNPGMDRIVILRGGTPQTNSAELLSSHSMGVLLREMKNRYRNRFIILDSAPVLTSADPLVLAGIVDAILIVVEAEKTQREDVQKVLEMLRDRPIIGTVFNKMVE